MQCIAKDCFAQVAFQKSPFCKKHYQSKAPFQLKYPPQSESYLKLTSSNQNKQDDSLNMANFMLSLTFTDYLEKYGNKKSKCENLKSKCENEKKYGNEKICLEQNCSDKRIQTYVPFCEKHGDFQAPFVLTGHEIETMTISEFIVMFRFLICQK